MQSSKMVDFKPSDDKLPEYSVSSSQTVDVSNGEFSTGWQSINANLQEIFLKKRTWLGDYVALF
jgi:hypothetical protein